MTRTELQALDSVPDRMAQLRAQLARVIVGQDTVIEHLGAALMVQGHVLVIGVPGLAKTLLVRCLARGLGWSFKRIQFTPDMMPSDVIGTELIQTDAQTGQRAMLFSPGPIFANLVLADEINRTPPRTQAALLEAMAERQVTAAGQTRPLDEPFVVIATQNPIEQEGTYPLPEAQLDRFMFSLNVGYPSEAEERRIAGDRQPDAHLEAELDSVFNAAEAVKLGGLIRRMPISEHVRDYTVALARASRPDDAAAPDAVREFVAWGAGPRAPQYLLLGARALAAMGGEPTPHCDHVRRIAPAVLSHRLVLSYAATGEGKTTQQIVDELLSHVRE